MKFFLVIDDYINNLELIKSILIKSFPDCQVFIAQSGKKGIKIAKEELPDIIFLDILMPVMDGFEVCNILKNDEITKHIPVLMVSALGDHHEVRIKGLNAGADAFITKPFDNVELIALSNVMLRIKHAEDLLRKRNENLEIFIKKQTKEFYNHEDRFLQITEYDLQFFWETDSTGIFTYLSPIIEKILGFDNNKYIGNNSFTDIVHKEHKRKMIVSLFDTFKKRKNISNQEYLFQHKNGSEIWITINGFPVFNKKKDLVGYRGVCHDITERKQTEEERLKNLNQIVFYQKKLKSLNLKLIRTEEKERRKIAEYLHDEIGQTLSIINIKLTYLLDYEHLPEAQNIIQESSNLVKDTIKKTRLITYNLSPPVLYELGLIQAVMWKLDQIEDKHNITTMFKSTEEFLVINEDVKILLYKSICELLTNTIKHANANLIEIEITKVSKEICITVSDNGKGFSNKPLNNLNNLDGFGLFSINERLEYIEGSITVESEIGKGTKVTLILPQKKD
ncbi:MAG: hypothetical protein COC12_14405 [Rhodobacteraceae bacterium]|nr:MAG: hypothetical protein COC12_14405 [Paracoccaceae bacterium]